MFEEAEGEDANKSLRTGCYSVGLCYNRIHGSDADSDSEDEEQTEGTRSPRADRGEARDDDASVPWGAVRPTLMRLRVAGVDTRERNQQIKKEPRKMPRESSRGRRAETKGKNRPKTHYEKSARGHSGNVCLECLNNKYHFSGAGARGRGRAGRVSFRN